MVTLCSKENSEEVFDSDDSDDGDFVMAVMLGMKALVVVFVLLGMKALKVMFVMLGLTVRHTPPCGHPSPRGDGYAVL